MAYPRVFTRLERLADFADDLAQQSHTEADAYRQDEHGPKPVDDLPCLTKQIGEIQ